MRKVNFSLFPSPVLLPQVAWNPMPKSAVLQNILFYFPASTECRPTGHVSGEEKTDCEYVCVCVRMLVAQLSPTLWDPMDYSLPGSYVHGNFLSRNTGVGCQFLPQRILPTQGLNLGLSDCRQILYHLSYHSFLIRHLC